MRSRLASLAPFTSVALLALTLSCSSGSSPGPSVVNASVSCGELGCGWLSEPNACNAVAAHVLIPGQFTDARIDPVLIGSNTVAVDANTFTADVKESWNLFDWTATTPVKFVVAASASDYMVRSYDPPVTDDLDVSSYAGMQLTQILFCVPADAPPPPPTPTLTVAVTAGTGFTRTWGWSIAKSSTTTSLDLAIGATADATYTVTVSASSLDSAFVASGTVTVSNPSTVDATGVVIEASYAGTPVTPDCGGFTGTIPAGTSIGCTWSSPLAASVNGTAVVVATTGGVPFTSSAAATFGGPTTVLDPCVLVTDDRAGSLGTACAADAPVAYTYALKIGPYTICEPGASGYPFSNTATLVAPSGATRSSTWNVAVHVPCTSAGCTLTQGYWKTHSKAGPAPYDARWKKVGPLEADTPFFRSGHTWLEVFRTPVRGSPYYALAHQYMAAKLNVLSGASGAILGDALETAESFFDQLTPTSPLDRNQQATVLALAALLDQYNNGRIGPGHCDDVERGGDSSCGDDDDHHGDHHDGRCEDRCTDTTWHDDAEHQACLERPKTDGKVKTSGASGQGIRAMCVVDPTPPPKPGPTDDACRKHDAADHAWAEACHPHHDHHEHGCRDEKKHSECRDHDAKDRKYGCGDRSKHQECRDHARRDASDD